MFVGSRQSPLLYLRKAFNLGRGLTKEGWIVVSGLAKGIDGAAHKGALSFNGHSLAILGTGINRYYPTINKGCQLELEKTGGVISEFPLSAKPLKYHFPRRNRIISGLSQGLIIVFGAAKSGAFITLDFALEEGRDVFSLKALESLIGCETLSLNQLKAYGKDFL